MPVTPRGAEEIDLARVQVRRAEDDSPAKFEERTESPNDGQWIAQMLNGLTEVDDIEAHLLRHDE